jgi:hypothetical protein
MNEVTTKDEQISELGAAMREAFQDNLPVQADVQTEFKRHVRIIYSVYNLESKVAALFLTEQIAELNKALPLDQTMSVETVAYDRVKRHEVGRPTNILIVLAAELMQTQMEAEIANLTTDGYVNVYAQDSSYSFEYAFDGSPWMKKYSKIVKINRVDDHAGNEDPEATKLSWRGMAVPHNKLSDEQRDLLRAAHEYENFSINTSARDLAFVFANEDLINTALIEKTPLVIQKVSVDNQYPKDCQDFISYRRHIQMVRNHIQRSFGTHHYMFRTGHVMLPTANIPDSFCTTASRLISYPHKEFVTYEDLSNCRLLRIVCEVKSKAIGIAKAMKAHDVWIETGVVYAIVDLPVIKQA